MVKKSRYIHKHVVGGGDIGNLASKLLVLVSAGKSVASEAGKRLL